MKQAVEVLLPLWTDIEVDDALELLGPGTVDSRVRDFAVKQLSKADDDVSSHPLPILQKMILNRHFRNFYFTCYNYFKP